MQSMYSHWMRNSTPLSYESELVRSLNRDHFLLSLFVPEPHRQQLLALYAFDAELAHVRSAVTEEINGHIRFAWWQESLDGIANGKPPRAHPVITSLTPMLNQKLLSREALLGLVETYRSAFPDKPETSALVHDEAAKLLQKICPDAVMGWKRAKALIDSHRSKYGRKMNLWLLLKLNWLGVF